MREDRNNKRIRKLFTVVSLLGLLFVLTETVLQLFGKSICALESCKLVASSARFGDLSILVGGLFIFSLFSITGIMSLRREMPGLENFIDLALVVSLACEGFFTGYQAFRIHAACLICLTVFGFIVVLGVLRLMEGKKAMIAGFASLLSVFSLFYFILPADSGAGIPAEHQMVLFYKPDCSHCAEVKKALDQTKLPVQHLSADEYSGLLGKMGIEHVPALYVNRKNLKFYLTGKDAILRYLKEGSSAIAPYDSDQPPPPSPEDPEDCEC
ncbi:MAG: hypothetical protein OEW15_19050 [Nitrospirota bacterium]|nr:hypothetical protein [Nitrospirota bacterium]